METIESGMDKLERNNRRLTRVCWPGGDWLVRSRGARQDSRRGRGASDPETDCSGRSGEASRCRFRNPGRFRILGAAIRQDCRSRIGLNQSSPSVRGCASVDPRDTCRPLAELQFSRSTRTQDASILTRERRMIRGPKLLNVVVLVLIAVCTLY